MDKARIDKHGAENPMQPFPMPSSSNGATVQPPKRGGEALSHNETEGTQGTGPAFKDVFTEQNVLEQVAQTITPAPVDPSIPEKEPTEAPVVPDVAENADVELRTATSDLIETSFAEEISQSAVPDRQNLPKTPVLQPTTIETAVTIAVPPRAVEEQLPSLTGSLPAAKPVVPEAQIATLQGPIKTATEGEATALLRTTVVPVAASPTASVPVPVTVVPTTQTPVLRADIAANVPPPPIPIPKSVKLEQTAPQLAPPLSTTAPHTSAQTTTLVPLAIAAQTSTIKTERSEKFSAATFEPFALGRSDGTGQTNSTTVVAPTSARTDLAAQITRQVVDVAQHMPARPVEITLSPEELGRVRMAVSTHDAGITLSIMAERPETLDLLRRNISQLGAQFEALGYENIAFSFQDGSDAQTAPDQREDQTPLTSSGETENEIAPLQIALKATAATGVDIRL